jgi:hypothetical protein
VEDCVGDDSECDDSDVDDDEDEGGYEDDDSDAGVDEYDNDQSDDDVEHEQVITKIKVNDDIVESELVSNLEEINESPMNNETMSQIEEVDLDNEIMDNKHSEEESKELYSVNTDSYKKMNLVALKNLVVSRGTNIDVTRMKKNELIAWLKEHV